MAGCVRSQTTFQLNIIVRLPVYNREDVDPVFTNKPELLIHFGSMDFFGYRHFRDAGSAGFDH